MLTLREEYSRQKAEKNKAINEAAVQWVLENVLLLNETFNREALQRLQGSIMKFDSTFAPFASKVPEVKKSLDDAVELMNRITMGEKVTRSDGRLRLTDEEKESIKEPATYMVKYLSVMYNNLSRFFNKDMKVMLEFPIFRKAMENPTTPLKDLAEANRLKKAILHALVPSPESQAILQRMYRSMDLPSLNYRQIADELLNLSVSDFRKLTQVEKVPLVVSAEKSTSPVPEASVPAMEAATSPNPKELDEDIVLTEQEQQLLKEIGEVDEKQLNTVIQGIKKIQGIVTGVPELSNLNTQLQNLQSQALATVTKGGALSGMKGKMIAATANMVYSFFDRLGDLYPKIEPLLPTDRAMTDEELTNLQTFMTRAQGGIMAKIGNWFKARSLPGLAPTEIAAEIINVVKAGQNDPAMALKATESLSNLFKRLGTLKLPPATTPQGQPIAAGTPAAQAAQGTAGAQGAAGAAPAGQTTAPGQAQGSQAAPPGGARQQTLAGTGAPAPGAATDPTALAAQMAPIMGLQPNDPNVVAQVKKLVDAGWKITPP